MVTGEDPDFSRAVTQLLLLHGADPSVTWRGETAFVSAYRAGNLTALLTLGTHGGVGDPTARMQLPLHRGGGRAVVEAGQPLLHLAAAGPSAQKALAVRTIN